MIAPSLFPKSRKKPVHEAVSLSIVMLAMLLVAGCEDVNYLENNYEVVVGKLDANGTPEWLEFFNNTVDNTAADIMQLSNGNLVISGYNRYQQCRPHFGDCKFTPTLAVLSTSGNILFKKEVNESLPLKYPLHLIQTSDNTTMVSPTGFFWDFDTEGNLVKQRRIPGCANSVTKTKDNGYLAFCKKSVTQLDNKLNTTGEKPFSSIDSMIEMNDNTGFLASAYAKDENMTNSLYVLHLSPALSLLNKTKVDEGGFTWRTKIVFSDSAYQIYYSTDWEYDGKFTYSRLREITLDKEGNNPAKRILKIPSTFAKTVYGEFAFIGFFNPWEDYQYADQITHNGKNKPVNEELSVAKSNNDGTIVWNTTLNSATAHTPIKIIQTRDGGFVFLAIREK